MDMAIRVHAHPLGGACHVSRLLLAHSWLILSISGIDRGVKFFSEINRRHPSKRFLKNKIRYYKDLMVGYENVFQPA